MQPASSAWARPISPVVRGATSSARPIKDPCEIIAACAYSWDPKRCSPAERSAGGASASCAIPSSVDHRASSTSPTAWPRTPSARLARDFRPAARVPVRRPGEHDRDGARARRAPARAGLLALQRDARADGRRCCDGLDVLVIDLQDVGTRIYTYIYTMANCLTAAPQARRQGRSSATGRIRSAASQSKGRCWSTASSRSSACTRSRCGTA